MSIFNRKITNDAQSRLTEEMVYAQVATEIQNGIRRDGLWAKAISEAELNEDKAKAIYIKLRAQSIFDEIHLAGEQEKLRQASRSESSTNQTTLKQVTLSDKKIRCCECRWEGQMPDITKWYFFKKWIAFPIAFLYLYAFIAMLIGEIIKAVNLELKYLERDSVESLAFLAPLLLFPYLFKKLKEVLLKRMLKCPSCGEEQTVNVHE